MVTWQRWEGVYGEIVKEFGFDRAADEAARDELDALLATRRLAANADLARLLEGEDVVVFGPAGKDIDWRYAGSDDVVIAADGATAQLMDAGVVPHVITTDFDGAPLKQVAANARGAIVVAHAHGDNRGAVAKYVPQLTGRVIGSTQAAPAGRVQNFGGFTDGDRAVFLADHFKAARVTLIGFDFDEPVLKPGRDAALKKRKLRWARALIKSVDVPVRQPTEGGPFAS